MRAAGCHMQPVIPSTLGGASFSVKDVLGRANALLPPLFLLFFSFQPPGVRPFRRSPDGVRGNRSLVIDMTHASVGGGSAVVTVETERNKAA